MLTTLEMPAGDVADSSVPFIPSPDAAAAADLLDTPTPAESPELAVDDLLGDAAGPPAVSDEKSKSNGHAAAVADKRNYWLVFPRSIRQELTAAGIEVQGQQKISDTHDRIYCRCTDEVKSAVEARFHADLAWEAPGATSNAAAIADLPAVAPASQPVNTEPLCEQPDADDSKTVVIQGDETAMSKTAMVVDPAQPPKPEPRTETTADKLKTSESRLLECSLEIYECELKVEASKDRLKLLREVHSELASEVQRLRSGFDYTADDDEDTTPQGTETAEAQTAVISTPPEPAPAAVGSLAWRSIPAIRVCNEPSPIKGLGAGKLATLAEKFPTLGDLEDARVATAGKGLHTVLPNGCGKGLGELLTERIIHWLTKTRDAGVFAELTGAGQASEPVAAAPAADLPPADDYDPATEPTLPASDAPDAADAAPDAPAAATPDAKQPAKKKGRKPKGGGATAQKELPAIVAPASSPAPDPTLPPGTPSAKEWNALNDDQQQNFILARTIALNTGKPNCLDPKHPVSQRSWESGYEANGTMADGAELKITDCPYIPGHEFDDWLRGWLSKDAINNYEAKIVTPAVPATAVPAVPSPTSPAAASPAAQQLNSLVNSLDDLL